MKQILENNLPQKTNTDYPLVVPRGERWCFRGKHFKVNDNYFIDMGPKQYWLLGVYASDGYVSGNHTSLSQSGPNGLKILSYIKDELQCEAPIVSYEPQVGQTVYQLKYSSKRIAEVFSTFGIVQNKTKTFALPPGIDSNNIKPFIAGYIDGDGCITIVHHKRATDMLCVSFVGTESFIYECSKLIPIPGKMRKHSMSDVYEIRWYSSKAIDVCEWIYSDNDIYHSYKFDAFVHGRELYHTTRDYRFGKLHQSIIDDFNSGELKTVKDCYLKYGTNATLMYNWFREWYKAGLLNRDYHIINPLEGKE